MFYLSTKSDYGLFLLSLLSKERMGDIIPLSLLVARTKLPYRFLSRIAAELVSAGFLKSKEGIGGGYKLGKKPEDISIASVIEALDGPWAPTRCTHGKNACPFETFCPMADDWQKNLRRKIWDLLESYTIKDFISEI